MNLIQFNLVTIVCEPVLLTHLLELLKELGAEKLLKVVELKEDA